MSPHWDEMRELSGGGFLAHTTDPNRAWLMDYIPSEDRAQVSAAIDEAIRTGSNFELEQRVLREDGSIGWTLSRAVPILGPEGEIVEWFGAARDITERKHAEPRLQLAEERQSFLLKLSDALRPLADPTEIQSVALRLLGEHLQLARCAYAEINPDGDSVTIDRSYHVQDIASFAGTYRMSAFAPRVLATMRRGETLAIEDMAEDAAAADPVVAAFYAAKEVRSFFAAPLVKDGRLVAILFASHRTPRHWSSSDAMLIEDVAERTWAALERARAEAALRESEERFRAILESALDYAIFTTDAQGRIETWPPGAEAVFGWTAEEAIGRDMAMTFVPEDRAGGVPARELMEAREKGSAPDVRWHLRKDGRRVFIEGSTQPMLGGVPRPPGFLKIGHDSTGRREWQERQNVLLAELQHRTRNLMSIVRSMFDKTRQDSASVEDLARTYGDRLAALARVQGLLSRLNETDRISFDELIRTELSAMGALDGQGHSERVLLDGPEGVRLRSSSVQTFALALHELATNSTKYGALAQPTGRLSVRWRVLGSVDEPRLRIEWVESGVHMPDPDNSPRGSGYGRELIERALPYQLNAETSYALGPDGVHCTIELPVSDSTRVEECKHA